MVCTFTPECATESPGGLIKCKLLIPIPEFMIQWVWAGTQVLAFLEFPGIIDAIGYFENPWSKTIIKLNLHICIELLKYSRYFYFLLLVILTSLQRWRGFWWCHWVKWGSGKVSQLPQVDRVSDRPQAALSMPAIMENSAMATGLEEVSFHFNPKEGQCQRVFKLPHNCTHFTF